MHFSLMTREGSLAETECRKTLTSNSDGRGNVKSLQEGKQELSRGKGETPHGHVAGKLAGLNSSSEMPGLHSA